ncbi:MAG: hypothetical protein ACP5GI_05210 [Sulfolobales archaeon]
MSDNITIIGLKLPIIEAGIDLAELIIKASYNQGVLVSKMEIS